MRPRRAEVVRFVYTLSDSEGRVFYVGLTHDVSNRLKKHSIKPYWPDVADVGVELVFGFAASAARERELIRELSPELNRSDREWEPVSGVRCRFFRFCGAQATTIRSALYGGIGGGSRELPVCDHHSVTAYVRERERAA